MLTNLADRIRKMNMMIMITDKKFQLIDCNTDTEYEVDTEEQLFSLVAEFERHNDEVKCITDVK